MPGRFYYGPTVDPGYAQFGASIRSGFEQGRARVDANEAEAEELRRFELEQARLAAAEAAAIRANAIREAMLGVIPAGQAHEVAPVAGAPAVALPSPTPGAVRPTLEQVMAGPAIVQSAGVVERPPVAAPMERRVRENVMVAEGPGGPIYIDPSRSMAAIEREMEQGRAVTEEQRVYELNESRMQTMIDRLTEEGVRSGATRRAANQAALETIRGLDLPDPYEPITDAQWADLEKKLGLEAKYATQGGGSAAQERLRQNDARRLAREGAEGLAASLYRQPGMTEQQMVAQITDEYGDVLDRGIIAGIAANTLQGGFTLENALSHLRTTRSMLTDPETGDPVMADLDPERWRELALPMAQELTRGMGGGLGGQRPIEQAFGPGETMMVDIQRINANPRAREGWELLRGVPAEEAVEDLTAAGYSPQFIQLFRNLGWETMNQTLQSAGTRQ